MKSLFITTFIKFFFILTPFFVLSTFISMTKDYLKPAKRKLALMVTLTIIIICFILFLFGNYIFILFGITLDSFRIGTGILLFLTSITLVGSYDSSSKNVEDEDIAIVPLAIPITVGPGTIGALLVMGGELQTFHEKLVAGFAVLLAILCVGLLLYVSSFIERILGKKGIAVLSKLTGLIIAAIAAQIVMTGINNFLK
jgi:multiple antibiotic resistance protein